MADVTFDIDRDAPPFVLGVSTILKRAAADPKLRKRMAGMRGVLGLRSASDPQCATVTFDRGRIAMSGHVPDGADLTITLDPNDASVKPKVQGIARHLAFAIAVSKVMEPPARPWEAEAAEFWGFAGGWPRMPAQLRVVCTDDGSEVTFGEANGSRYEVHGTADALRSVFSGASIIGQDALDGRIKIVGTIEHASIVTGRSIAWALGGGR